jgi:hypothetical protein
VRGAPRTESRHRQQQPDKIEQQFHN